MTKIGIATVTYNAERHIEKFILSLLLNKESISFVVFVDNHSGNDIRPFIKKLDGHIDYHIITNSKNIGYSAAINQGIDFLRKKDCEYILVTNNDITIQEGGVALLLEDAEKSDADVVGVPTTNDGNSFVLSNSFDDKKGCVTHSVISKALLLEKSKTQTVESTLYVQGGIVFFRERFFRTVGVYDPFLFFGGDELDFLLRVTRCEKQVNCVISLRAWSFFDHYTHHDGRFKMLKAKMMLQGVVYVLLKHGFGPRTLLFRNVVGDLLRNLGKKNFIRHLVLTFFFMRSFIISYRRLRQGA